MGSFRERYQSAREKPARGGMAAASYEELPNLSEAMAGVPGTKGTLWDVPPHSLTIWLEGSTAKFCLSAEGTDVKTFGTFADLAEGLPGVEKALETGRCETKRATGRNTR